MEACRQEYAFSVLFYVKYKARCFKTRDEYMTQAYWSGHYTLAQVGEYFGVSYATVSRTLKQTEKRGSVKFKPPCFQLD